MEEPGRPHDVARRADHRAIGPGRLMSLNAALQRFLVCFLSQTMWRIAGLSRPGAHEWRHRTAGMDGEGTAMMMTTSTGRFARHGGPTGPDIQRVRACVARAGGDTDKLLELAGTSFFLASKLMDRFPTSDPHPGDAKDATEHLAIACLALAKALDWPE